MGNRTFKYFDKQTLKRANRVARKRGYNRTLKPSFVKALPDNRVFPVIFNAMHGHAKGFPVGTHMRCWILFDEKGTKGFLDCDLSIFNGLDGVEIPIREP